MTTQNWSFYVVVLKRTAKKYTKSYNARAEPLFCPLNLLFSGVPVAVAFVVILNSLNLFTESCGVVINVFSHDYQNQQFVSTLTLFSFS